MGRKRRTFSAKQKSQIAVEALQERMTSAEIAKKHEVHPNQVSQWKRHLVEGVEELFDDGRSRGQAEEEQAALIARLYQHIGQLKVELDWVKKKSGEHGYG